MKKYILLICTLASVFGCAKKEKSDPVQINFPAMPGFPSFQSDTKITDGGSSGTRGGGDTDAVHFIAYARRIADWMEFRAIDVSFEDSAQFRSTVERLEKNMGSTEKAEIAFVDTELFDENHTPKMALYVRDPLLIQINRAHWSNLNLKEKYTLAALEIFGVIGMGKRYAVSSIIEENFNDINSDKFGRPLPKE